MTEFPEERVGFTDMTFSIIRFEATNILRDMLYVPPGPNKCTEFFANLTIREKEKWISDCHQRLEDKYLKGSDMRIPLFWVTATISRLIMSKMWLIVYHPYQRRDGGESTMQTLHAIMSKLVQAPLYPKRPKTSFSSPLSRTLNTPSS
jgi:hypothetical protein